MADAKKNGIKVTVPGEPVGLKPEKMDVIKLALAKFKAGSPGKVSPGMLISSLNAPVFIKYGDDVIRMSAKQRQPVDDTNLLPSQLPQGIYLKKPSA